MHGERSEIAYIERGHKNVKTSYVLHKRKPKQPPCLYLLWYFYIFQKIRNIPKQCDLFSARKIRKAKAYKWTYYAEFSRNWRLFGKRCIWVEVRRNWAIFLARKKTRHFAVWAERRILPPNENRIKLKWVCHFHLRKSTSIFWGKK